MTAGELAAELEVSERTIFRDIVALSGSGVPVYSVRGPAGGFELLDGFDRALPVPASAERPIGVARARVRLAPTARRLATLLGRPEGIHDRPLLPVPDERQGWIEVSIRMPSLESTVHDLLALGPGVQVIRPIELRERLHLAAAEIADANAGPPPVTRR
jgi:predicted DNA-binding transcriptional regulator YafY